MDVLDRETVEQAVRETDSWTLIDALWETGDLGLAAREFKHRTKPLRGAWWQQFRLSRANSAGWGIWGLSLRWFCFCPWNGDTAWITLPFLYFGVGTMNIELRVGSSKYGLTFDIRWRWE